MARQPRRIPGGVYPGHTNSRSAVRYGQRNPFLSRAGLYVIPSDPLAEDNDDRSTPFETIQAAIDYAIEHDVPDVWIEPGTYDEGLQARGFVRLYSLGGPDIVTIAPSAPNTPALAIAGATEASLTAWAADPANYAANLGDLVSNGDQGIAIASGILFVGSGTDAPGVAMASPGIPSAFYAKQCSFTNGDNSDSIWADDASIRLFRCGRQHLTGSTILQMQGTATLDAEQSVLGELELSENAAFDGYICYLQDVTLSGASRFGKSVVKKTSDVHINGSLDQDDTSEFELHGGYILEIVNVEEGAEWLAYDVHVQDINATGTAITLVNAAPLTACIMDGGRYIGGLVDVGGRLTRTLGS